MKKEFYNSPYFMHSKESYGFDWLEHVTAIPSPLVLVTNYKSNGKTNATLQSWLTFTNENGFYCILSSVNKYSHMYTCVRGAKQTVINFPSVEVYKKCLTTIENNRFNDDELSVAGLTVEKARKVHAPLVKECFLNLECEYMWEKEIFPHSRHVVMCVKVVNVWMDSDYYNKTGKGRYGETGYLYNIHSPLNPETGEEDDTYLGVIEKYKTYDEL